MPYIEALNAVVQQAQKVPTAANRAAADPGAVQKAALAEALRKSSGGERSDKPLSRDRVRRPDIAHEHHAQTTGSRGDSGAGLQAAHCLAIMAEILPATERGDEEGSEQK